MDILESYPGGSINSRQSLLVDITRLDLGFNEIVIVKIFTNNC